MLIINAFKIAKENYDKKGFEHALRVAYYAIENPLAEEKSKDRIFALALMHDILEDTDFNIVKMKGGDTDFYVNLMILTKGEDEEYLNYIKKIKNYASKFPEAYIVKLADMRDHLSQVATLTDKLRDKYLEALPFLL